MYQKFTNVNFRFKKFRENAVENWHAKDWRIFQVVSTIKVRQFLANDCMCHGDCHATRKPYRPLKVSFYGVWPLNRDDRRKSQTNINWWKVLEMKSLRVSCFFSFKQPLSRWLNNSLLEDIIMYYDAIKITDVAPSNHLNKNYMFQPA